MRLHHFSAPLLLNILLRHCKVRSEPNNSGSIQYHKWSLYLGEFSSNKIWSSQLPVSRKRTWLLLYLCACTEWDYKLSLSVSLLTKSFGKQLIRGKIIIVLLHVHLYLAEVVLLSKNFVLLVVPGLSLYPDGKLSIGYVTVTITGHAHLRMSTR